MSKDDSWGKRHAIKLGAPSRNAGYILRDLAAKKRWRISDSSDINAAFSQIAQGEHQILIVDDSDSRVASTVLRTQIFNPYTLLTPTMVIFGEDESNQSTKKVHAHFRSITFVDSPITADKFNGALSDLLDRWSSGVYAKCRIVLNELLRNNLVNATGFAVEMVKDNENCPLIYVLLSHLHRARGDIQGAEKILLKAINKGMYELTTVLPLIDLYMMHGMPHVAVERIDEAMRDFGRPEFLNFDAVQGHLMCNDVEAALAYVQDIQQSPQYNRFAHYYLPRMFYAAGCYDEFMHHINERDDRFELYHRKWKAMSSSEHAKYAATIAKRGSKDRTGRTGELDGVERMDFDYGVNLPLFDTWFKMGKQL